MAAASAPAAAGAIPPEAEITAPDWYAQVDPARGGARRARRGRRARRAATRARSTSAPGSHAATTRAARRLRAGAGGGRCDGSGARGAVRGRGRHGRRRRAQGALPANAGDFRGREPGRGGQTLERAARTPSLRLHGQGRATSTAGDADAARTAATSSCTATRTCCAGFPSGSPSDGAASPRARRPRRRQPQRADRGDLRRRRARVQPRRRRGARLAGARRPAAAPPRRPRRSRAARSPRREPGRVPRVAGRRRPRPRRRRPRSSPPTTRASSTSGARTARAAATRGREPRVVGQAAAAVRRRARSGERNRTQHGFLGSPVLADLDGDGGGSRSSPPRWTATSTRGTTTARRSPGFPVLVVDPSKVASIDPATHAVTFNDAGGRRAQPGRDRRHARGRRPHRRRQAGDRRRDERGVRRERAAARAA